ncbi:hypothetical protein V6N12_052074 [Hibiscus sabdariffa]|uniref:Uncharacterized protein n=1 Tax=Hibiscus sabdariffa TaxID=183260 RepID=A0ABR2GHG9_9ROSI
MTKERPSSPTATFACFLSSGEGGGGLVVLENLRNAGWFGGLEYLDFLPGIDGLEGEEGEPKDLIESAVAANVVFDFLLGAPALVEFLGVGVVPAGESNLRRRSMAWFVMSRIRVRRRGRENWE